MGVARQAPAPATGRLVSQLKAQGEDERDHPFDKGLAVVKQLHVSRFVLKIDGDRPVFTERAGGMAHGSPADQRVGSGLMTQNEGNTCTNFKGIVKDLVQLGEISFLV